ncbi:MAG: Fe-S oxidoreductase [Papillibacter sp.]|nr:Fe-S oxidoreductase [Papillibacter sp.]
MSDFFGKKIKELGFGLMRLPVIPGGEQKDIDFDQVQKMVDLFMERGYSYFDTAYLYHNGYSETVIKKCLVGKYPRDSFQVIDKMPLWNIKGREDYEGIFKTQLERTGLEYFDLYFLHGIGVGSLETLDKTGGWDFLKSLKERGLAKHIGFSYHSPAEPLNKILDEHPEVELVQLQINYVDWDSDSVQSRLCYEACRKHGVAVSVMEPIKGGALANPHPDIVKIFKDANPNASVASWALRFAASLEGVTAVLSGMSNLEQLDENTQTMMDFKPLTDAERAVIDEAVKAFSKISTIPCTACKYCMDECPQKINIPGIIGMLNDYTKYQSAANQRFGYNMMTGAGGKASSCVECRLCEKHCPQNIEITKHLKEAVKLYE